MKIFAIVLLMLLSLNLGATPVEVGHSQYKNLFVLTTKRAMRGAEVRVFYSNGDLVTAQRVKRRKMIIDFCDARSGQYRIVVAKGKTTEEFTYERK